MCMACVAQGVMYVGGATAVLQGMAFRARRRAGGGTERSTIDTTVRSGKQEAPDEWEDTYGDPRGDGDSSEVTSEGVQGDGSGVTPGRAPLVSG